MILAAAIAAGASPVAPVGPDRPHGAQVVAAATVTIVRAEHVGEEPGPGGVLRHVTRSATAGTGITISFE
jgi:hypothetical protein